MIMQRHDPFLPNVKAFLVAVLECSPEDITEEACAEVCGEGQPLEHLFVELVAKATTTREGKEFTRISYKRLIPPMDVKEMLPEDQKLYPEGFFEALA